MLQFTRRVLSHWWLLSLQVDKRPQWLRQLTRQVQALKFDRERQ